MKLTINGRLMPEWWELEEGGCFKTFNPVGEMLCFADEGAQTVSEFTNTEWAYDLVNSSINWGSELIKNKFLIKMQEGFANEINNFAEMVQCFPCG